MENRRPVTFTFDDIRRYRRGLMTREEMHAFEKASMEDPFLAEALEGYMEADLAEAEKNLEIISARISSKNTDTEKAVVVSMPRKGMAFWRVAAMVIVIAGAGLLTYKLLDKDPGAPSHDGLARIEETKPATKPAEQPATPAAGLPEQPTVETKDKPGTQVPAQQKPATVNQGNTTFNSPAAPPADEIVRQPEVSTLKDQRAEEKATAARREAEKQEASADKQTAAESTYGAYRNNAAKAAPIQNAFRGRVLSPENQPLANANVRLDNTRQVVHTDNDGNFSLKAKDSVVVATVESEGYIDTRVRLRSNSDNTINIGNIVLQPDPNMEPVAVTGIGTSRKERVADTLSTRPEGGWESFQQYVANKLNTTVDTTANSFASGAELELEFYIDANGLPKDFKVISGGDAALNRQAIDAIKQGPKWETRRKKTRVLIKFPGK